MVEDHFKAPRKLPECLEIESGILSIDSECPSSTYISAVNKRNIQIQQELKDTREKLQEIMLQWQQTEENRILSEQRLTLARQEITDLTKQIEDKDQQIEEHHKMLDSKDIQLSHIQQIINKINKKLNQTNADNEKLKLEARNKEKFYKNTIENIQHNLMRADSHIQTLYIYSERPCEDIYPIRIPEYRAIKRYIQQSIVETHLF